MPATPTAVSVQLAEAVVAQLIAGGTSPGFSMAFQPERGWLPEFTLENLADLRVTVVAVKVERQELTRGSDRRAFDVDVGFQQAVPDTSNESIDPLVALVEEAADYFRDLAETRLAISATRNANYMGQKTDPIAAWEELNQKLVWASTLTLSYLVFK